MKKTLYIVSFLALTSLLACSDLLVPPGTSDLNLEDFEYAWKVIGEDYPYLEFKKIDWDSVYTAFRPRAENAQGDEFYQVLFDLLAELNDGHVYLKTEGGGKIFPSYPTPRMWKDRKAYSPFVVRKYFDHELHLTDDKKFEYGILEGNIGYVYISEFLGTHQFSTALDFLKDTKGLIIDDRNGKGGNAEDIIRIMSRFTTSPFQPPVFYKRGEPIQWPLIQPDGPYQYTNPVVLLINGAAFSARENFAEWIKQLPHVTAVGDTTAGGGGGITDDMPGDYQLPSGKWIHFTTIDLRRVDGLPVENLGVLPDIQVVQTEEDIRQGRDKQLEYAIDLLK
ncbi:MAG: S41 family peptidase [Rhodothermales bacterium]